MGDSPLISKLRKMAHPGEKQGRANGDYSRQNYTPQKELQDSDGIERCDFCSKPIPPDHKHFADLNEMKFMCACEMCAVLQAEKGEYQQVPERYVFMKNFDLPEDIWQQLKIPVNMAFMVYNSEREQPIAFYPSPAGATESELHISSWDVLLAKNPALKTMEADLEGFMINRLDKPHEHYIVPIDCCYKLIGLIRLKWQGMHGGKEMRSSVRDFFEKLKMRAL